MAERTKTKAPAPDRREALETPGLRLPKAVAQVAAALAKKPPREPLEPKAKAKAAIIARLKKLHPMD